MKFGTSNLTYNIFSLSELQVAEQSMTGLSLRLWFCFYNWKWYSIRPTLGQRKPKTKS